MVKGNEMGFLKTKAFQKDFKAQSLCAGSSSFIINFIRDVIMEVLRLVRINCITWIT